MMSIKDGYQQWRKDSKGVLLRWSTAQEWQWHRDGDCTRTAMVQGRLSTTAINDNHQQLRLTTAVDKGDRR
jgi:hypothetical protein